MKQNLCPICHSTSIVFQKGNTDPVDYFSANESRYAITANPFKIRLPVHKCRACGHGFVAMPHDKDLVTDKYIAAPPDYSFLSETRSRRKTSRKIINRINKLMNLHSGRLLDYGCGPGIFLSEARKYGWDISGVEIARWSLKYAAEKLKIHSIVSDPASLPRSSFDVIVAFDVIEHVIDPFNFMKVLKNLLSPGGLIVITTPNFDSYLAKLLRTHWYAVLPEHLHYFTLKSMQQVLAKNDLKLVDDRCHTRYLSLPHLMFRTEQLIKLPLPKLSFLPLTIPVNLGDEMELYIRHVQNL